MKQKEIIFNGPFGIEFNLINQLEFICDNICNYENSDALEKLCFLLRKLRKGDFEIRETKHTNS